MRWNVWGTVGAAVVATCSLASFVHAGGFGIIADIPRPDHDARLQNCVLVYQAIGCHALNGDVKATFEGKVDGKRVSLLVEKVAEQVEVPHEISGWEYHGINHPHLPAGRWVLSITARSPWTIPVVKNGKATDQKTRMTLVKLIPFNEEGAPITKATQGAKYDQGVVNHSVSLADREKTITQLLLPGSGSTTVSKGIQPDSTNLVTAR